MIERCKFSDEDGQRSTSQFMRELLSVAEVCLNSIVVPLPTCIGKICERVVYFTTRARDLASLPHSIETGNRSHLSSIFATWNSSIQVVIPFRETGTNLFLPRSKHCDVENVHWLLWWRSLLYGWFGSLSRFHQWKWPMSSARDNGYLLFDQSKTNTLLYTKNSWLIYQAPVDLGSQEGLYLRQHWAMANIIGFGGRRWKTRG